MSRFLLRRIVCAFLILGFLLTMATILGTGCGPSTVYIRPAPPHSKPEIIPSRPSSKAVWVGGHWKWDTDRYIWMDGHWELHPKGAAWVPGYWQRTPKGWKWRPGRWRKH